MKTRSTCRRIELAVLLVMSVCLITLCPVFWQTSAQIVRDIEEVVVEAKDLPLFLGQPTDRIHLYRYNSTHPDGFEPILFQIDRRARLDLLADCDGSVQNCEYNYAFDANGNAIPGALDSTPSSEIVFLARDTGPRAPDAVVWKAGNVADVRYEIRVNDMRDVSGDGTPELVESGYVYAYRWNQAHTFELPDKYYVGWTQNHSPDADRPAETCKTNDTNQTRGQLSCGLFAGDPLRLLAEKATYQLRFMGHWIITRLYLVPPNSSTPSGELFDRMKLRALGPDGQTEQDWSMEGCPRVVGVKRGPVRMVRVIKGARSGPGVSRVDWLYPTHFRTRVRFRLHEGVAGIYQYMDFLQPTAPADIYVQSGTPCQPGLPCTPHATINGNPDDDSDGTVDPFPGQFEDWTQVNTSLGRLVHLFKETRELTGATAAYHFEDDATVNHTPQFQNGSYGNFGERWIGAMSDQQDRDCNLAYPDDPSMLWKQTDATNFISSATPMGPKVTSEAETFSNWAQWPLRYESQRQDRLVQYPPPQPPPMCVPRMTPTDPANGRYLDQRIEAPTGCTDSTVANVLYRALGPGTFTFLAKVASGATHRDYSIRRGQTYRYLARGQNADGVEGPASDIVTLTVVDNEIPPVPMNVTATSWNHSVNLSWQRSIAWDLKGYNIYLATTSGGPYTRANPSLIQIPVTAHTAGGLQNGVTYYCVVRAVDLGNNESVDSQEVSATPQP